MKDYRAAVFPRLCATLVTSDILRRSAPTFSSRRTMGSGLPEPVPVARYSAHMLNRRSSRRRAAAALILAGLAGCGSDPRFVKPVATPVASDRAATAQSKYADGYLRIFVSSNLDTTGKMLDFGDKDQRPAMLLISARFGKGTVASFAKDAEPEIPVLLYDVQTGKTQSSVVNNALLTEGLLVDPESLSQSPQLQIYVRGVPADKARWVTDLLQVATAEPMLRVGMNFVPGGAAFSPLSTKLGDMLSEEIKTSNKPWEEKTLLGLRADQGLSQLDGRQFVVLLDPSTIDLKATPELRPCDLKRSATGLCLATGEPWVPAQAYVRFELNVTDFRSVKDFLGADPGCESDERTWGNYRALLASGQLARHQTEYERLILLRGDLLADIRRSQNEVSGAPYLGRVLMHAQQFALLPTPEDAFWQQHFKARAEQLNGCIRSTAIRGQTQLAQVWDSAVGVFRQLPSYPAWAETLATNADPEAPALRAAEEQLGTLTRVLEVSDVQQLDARSRQSLSEPAAQLQQMLAASYAAIAQQIVGSQQPAEQKSAQLRQLAVRTVCMSCRELLLTQASAVAAAAAPLPVPAPSSETEPGPGS